MPYYTLPLTSINQSINQSIECLLSDVNGGA